MTRGIGDTIPVETGGMSGPTVQGVQTLTDRDPGATWNPATRSIEGSCAPGVCADGIYHAESPRIVPVALFDVQTLPRHKPDWHGWLSDYPKYLRVFHPDAGAGCHS